MNRDYLIGYVVGIVVGLLTAFCFLKVREALGDYLTLTPLRQVDNHQALSEIFVHSVGSQIELARARARAATPHPEEKGK